MSASPNRSFVMVADIAGSAGLYEKLSEREAAHTVDRCLKRMIRSVEAYRGRIVQQVSDELLAAFDNGESACQAAIDMHQRLADLPPVSGHKLSIRIGLHCGEATPEALFTDVARVGGMARADQILCSQSLVDALPASGLLNTIPRPDLGQFGEGTAAQGVCLLHWPAKNENSQLHSMFGPLSAMALDRLCIRYRGKAYLLDDKSPVLTLGRDPASKLVIEDRKASRQHGRIERRHNGYHLIDTSTNGSFVTIGGRQEILVRKHEVLLEEKGTICFGSSANDPGADRIEYEHL